MERCAADHETQRPEPPTAVPPGQHSATHDGYRQSEEKYWLAGEDGYTGSYQPTLIRGAPNFTGTMQHHQLPALSPRSRATRA